MPSTVYYGSPRQARWDANETLPAKLDRILERLDLRGRVKDEVVAVKMHVGNNLGYSTVHPLFVHKVVQAIKEGGGKPFIVDVNWDMPGAEERGYAHETVGCPIYPAAGPDEKYFVPFAREYKNIKEWKLAGMIRDATFLVNLSHAKGHPSCAYGGAFKNLALGCMIGETRSAMHDTCHFDPYWFPEKCPDEKARKRIVAACPFEAIVEDREDPTKLHLHLEPCNQCGRCLQAAPPGSLKIDPVNFHAFQEACAISTDIALSTFAPGKAVHLVLATNITPLCDCFGFTSMPVLPDVGVFGSDDIVALDTAVLDALAKTTVYEENLPSCMEIVTHEGHPLSWFHGPLKDPYKVVEYGERLGLGSRKHELVDVFPVEKTSRPSLGYLKAKQ
jgi:uncharacterized protein